LHFEKLFGTKTTLTGKDHCRDSAIILASGLSELRNSFDITHDAPEDLRAKLLGLRFVRGGSGLSMTRPPPELLGQREKAEDKTDCRFSGSNVIQCSQWNPEVCNVSKN
jgi:hypothetical protein